MPISTPSDTSETIYYSDADVKITNARAVLTDKTYSISNITSVVAGQKPGNGMPGCAVMVVGVLIAAGVFEFRDPMVGSNLLLELISALVITTGFWLLLTVKPVYVVKIGSASGEKDALVSADRQYIQRVVAAINEAIIKRG
jgi:hypothetical protein